LALLRWFSIDRPGTYAQPDDGYRHTPLIYPDPIRACRFPKEPQNGAATYLVVRRLKARYLSPGVMGSPRIFDDMVQWQVSLVDEQRAVGGLLGGTGFRTDA
jgi:hypothetical protein